MGKVRGKTAEVLLALAAAAKKKQQQLQQQTATRASATGANGEGSSSAEAAAVLTDSGGESMGSVGGNNNGDGGCRSYGCNATQSLVHRMPLKKRGLRSRLLLLEDGDEGDAESAVAEVAAAAKAVSGLLVVAGTTRDDGSGGVDNNNDDDDDDDERPKHKLVRTLLQRQVASCWEYNLTGLSRLEGSGDGKGGNAGTIESFDWGKVVARYPPTSGGSYLYDERYCDGSPDCPRLRKRYKRSSSPALSLLRDNDSSSGSGSTISSVYGNQGDNDPMIKKPVKVVLTGMQGRGSTFLLDLQGRKLTAIVTTTTCGGAVVVPGTEKKLLQSCATVTSDTATSAAAGAVASASAASGSRCVFDNQVENDGDDDALQIASLPTLANTDAVTTMGTADATGTATSTALTSAGGGSGGACAITATGTHRLVAQQTNSYTDVGSNAITPSPFPRPSSACSTNTLGSNSGRSSSVQFAVGTGSSSTTTNNGSTTGTAARPVVVQQQRRQPRLPRFTSNPTALASHQHPNGVAVVQKAKPVKLVSAAYPLQGGTAQRANCDPGTGSGTSAAVSGFSTGRDCNSGGAGFVNSPPRGYAALQESNAHRPLLARASSSASVSTARTHNSNPSDNFGYRPGPSVFVPLSSVRRQQEQQEQRQILYRHLQLKQIEQQQYWQLQLLSEIRRRASHSAAVVASPGRGAAAAASFRSGSFQSVAGTGTGSNYAVSGPTALYMRQQQQQQDQRRRPTAATQPPTGNVALQQPPLRRISKSTCCTEEANASTRSADGQVAAVGAAGQAGEGLSPSSSSAPLADSRSATSRTPEPTRPSKVEEVVEVRSI